MKDLEMMELPNVFSLWSMSGPFSALADDRDGICYILYFYKEFMAPKGGDITFRAIDGAFPDYDNLSSGGYALTTEVYVVIREGLDHESTAYKLRGWLLGADG
ncbi:MAG: hypothetical protein SWQ30_14425 [Thermodesulfobacteriota bacterium]|nr:hypothetical protein [Thermodesulfobacteriota bacterium]